jgi:hypothetical protein
MIDLYWSSRHNRRFGKISVGFYFQMFKDFLNREFQWLVDHNSHGTALSMFANVSDALGKNSIGETRHRQQKMILEAGRAA